MQPAHFFGTNALAGSDSKRITSAVRGSSCAGVGAVVGAVVGATATCAVVDGAGGASDVDGVAPISTDFGGVDGTASSGDTVGACAFGVGALGVGATGAGTRAGAGGGGAGVGAGAIGSASAGAISSSPSANSILASRAAIS